MPASPASPSPSTDGSPFRDDSGMDSSSTTPTSLRYRTALGVDSGALNSTLLRAQQAEYERLKIDSFNQALRINFLEERLLRYKQGTAFESEDLENEVFQTRLTLQERENELKQKRNTIMRATEYMTNLQEQLKDAAAEIDRLRAQQQQQQSPSRTATSSAADELRAELQLAHDQAATDRSRIAALEAALLQHEDSVTRLTAKQHERTQQTADHTRECERLQQALKSAEAALSSARADSEQWRKLAAQRDDDAARARDQYDALVRDREAADVRTQAKRTQRDEQLQTQLAQLQRELDAVRADHARAGTEREHDARLARERMRLDADAAQHERTRLQTEVERLENALEKATSDADAMRLESVKLTAACEHKAETLASYKTEREQLLETAQAVEREVQQWQRACAERDATIARLESRVQTADDDVARVRSKLEAATAQRQQSASERMRALEGERQMLDAECKTLEQERDALQQDVALCARDLKALELRIPTLETELADAQAREREAADRAAHYERELETRSQQLAASEQALAKAAEAATSRESTERDRAAARASRFAAEKSELLHALEDAQTHADTLQQRVNELETTRDTLRNELDDAAHELRALVGQSATSNDRSRVLLASQLRDAIESLRSEFAAESAAVNAEWQQQTARATTQLEHLARQLSASEGKLEVLQRTTVHAHDGKQATERTWAARYEKLRNETDSERRALETALRDTQAAAARSDAALARATSDLESQSRATDTAREALESQCADLQASNRVLYDEVRAKRRALEHSRRQHVRAVQENKDLLAAVAVCKAAVADREQDIARLKAAVRLQAQQRVGMGDVKQTLLEQLEHTQFMINETYKRWSESALCSTGSSDPDDPDAATLVHLDESIERLEIVTERWHEFIGQSRELQRRYSSVWQRSSASDVRPAWAVDVERKAARLLTESVRVSEALHDVVENVLRVIQRERNERRAFRHERLAVKSVARESLSNRNNEKDWRSSDRAVETATAMSNQQSPRHGGNSSSPSMPTKRVSLSRANSSRRTSGRPQASTDGSGSSAPAVFAHSLSSLSRLDSELQAIENQIRAHVE